MTLLLFHAVALCFYSQDTKTGGSNGATMRFAPEANHGANAGLLAARNFLEPIKKQFQWSVR